LLTWDHPGGSPPTAPQGAPGQSADAGAAGIAAIIKTVTIKTAMEIIKIFFIIISNFFISFTVFLLQASVNAVSVWR
jgi:hypothetical protein